MGGCRCIFRDCDVASNKHPEMHFFHFPVKNPERCDRWIDLSGALHLLREVSSVVKNRVVCVRHFRDECFMNYTKKRLTNSALPTLMRYGDVAIDYDTPNGHPKTVRIPKPTLTYLIPPSTFKCPLDFNVKDYEMGEKLFAQDNNVDLGNNSITETVEQIFTTTNQLQMNVINKKAQKRILNGVKSTPAKKSKLTNIKIVEDITLTSEIPKKILNKHVQNDEFLIFHDEIEQTENDFQIYDLEMDDIIVTPQRTKENVISITKEQGIQTDIGNTSHDVSLKELTKLQKQLDEVKKKCSESQRICCKLKIENESLKSENSVYKVENENFDDEKMAITEEKNKLENDLRKLLEDNGILKQNHNDLIKKYKKLEMQQLHQQVSTVSTSSTATALPAFLTKPQLFNGIKKYLSASMIALLRMEMFGNSEREWKPDERRTSIDILSLGENVYNFMSDEWRFRLPAINHVRSWLSETKHLADDDETDL